MAVVERRRQSLKKKTGVKNLGLYRKMFFPPRTARGDEHFFNSQEQIEGTKWLSCLLNEVLRKYTSQIMSLKLLKVPYTSLSLPTERCNKPLSSAFRGTEPALCSNK